jgi:hypothetical protein
MFLGENPEMLAKRIASAFLRRHQTSLKLVIVNNLIIINHYLEI